MATDRPDVTPALIAGLAVEAERLSAEGQRLSDELHARGQELIDVAQSFRDGLRALRNYRIFQMAVGVVVVLLIVGLAVIATLNYRSGAAIRSCTTPDGTCYQRSQQATETALSRLVVSFCAGIYADSPKDAERCVAASLKALSQP